MELPSLGAHCAQGSCKQLDFLPMKCDACLKIFCKDHIKYDDHSCAESYKKDRQVPVCPLCNKPIPLQPGQVADTEVSRHIDTDCQSDPAKERRKIYTNRCSYKSCKTKELVPFKCERCHSNYCIRHRLEADHECKGFQNSGQGISQAGAAAVARTAKPQATSKPKPPQQTTLSNFGRDLDRERRERSQQGTGRQALQGNMSEDEALAQALAMSMADAQPQPARQAPANASEAERRQQQEEADAALARALAESEQEARRQRLQGQSSQQQQQQSGRRASEKSCQVS